MTETMQIPPEVFRAIMGYRVAKREARQNYDAYVAACAKRDQKLAAEYEAKRGPLTSNAATMQRRMLEAIEAWV